METVAVLLSTIKYCSSSYVEDVVFLYSYTVHQRFFFLELKSSNFKIDISVATNCISSFSGVILSLISVGTEVEEKK